MGYWGTMSQLNPYEIFLGSREPVQVLAAMAGELQAILNQLGPDRADHAAAPDNWSARQIACHLADCEIAFAFRLRQTLGEDHHTIQPFDQEKWAAQYAAYSAQEALAAFTAIRNWNLALLRSLPPEAHATQVTHPERGTMTFRTIVETMAGHDLNHLGQLESIAKKLVPRP